MIDIVNYFDTFYRAQHAPSLKTMKYFMDEYNWFEKEMKIVHIAGTNGKGSTTKIITEILIKSGYKVGTIISPHLIDYCERITINNVKITHKEIEKYILELDPKIKKYNEYARKNDIDEVTFFELITMIALLHFREKEVDFVVMETGMGGLYDGTNIITKPIASIITSIGYDHTNSLGDTLEEIASQKAGIIKPNSDTVIFKQSKSVNQVFIDKCKSINNKLHIIEESDIENYYFDENYQYFDFKNYSKIKLKLFGKAQVRNTALSLEVINIIKDKGFEVPDKAIKQALATIVNPGRMEVLHKNPTIIFDGAHNIPAMENFVEMINMYYPNKHKKYIISILERKKYDDMLKIISTDKNAKFILTSGNDETRYTSKETLYDCAKKYIEESKLEKADLEQALQQALKGKELTFVIGSFYVYGTVVDVVKG